MSASAQGHELEELRVKVERAADEALSVFAEVGKLTAETSRARVAAEGARASAERAEAAVRRVESIAKRIEDATEEAGKARAASLERRLAHEESHGRGRRLDSLAQVEEDDDTGIRDIKAELSVIAERHRTELAVSAAYSRHMKMLATGLGIVLAIAAVCGVGWAVFTFAVNHAAGK